MTEKAPVDENAERAGGDALHTKLGRVVDGFIEAAVESLAERWDAWPLDLSEREVYEAIGALLARQVTLACELARSPSTWNEHSAPLFLRAMCDVHINLAWILGDPPKRSKEFVLHGLGQLKLEIAHRKAHAAASTDGPDEKLIIDALEGFLRSQRHDFLTIVNVGSWSGKSTRTMAEEAGCLDFYNFVYSPFSGAVHSQWQHVARFNLETCANPLHGLHRIPIIPNGSIEPDYLYLAAKYLQKTMESFDARYTTTGVESVLSRTIALLSQEFGGDEGDAQVDPEDAHADKR